MSSLVRISFHMSVTLKPMSVKTTVEMELYSLRQANPVTMERLRSKAVSSVRLTMVGIVRILKTFAKQTVETTSRQEMNYVIMLLVVLTNVNLRKVTNAH